MGAQKLGRTVGLVIAGLATGAAAVLWFLVASGEHAPGAAPSQIVLFGVLPVSYDPSAPGPRAILGAIALSVLFAAGIALLERRATNRSRRSSNAHLTPLAPKIVMAPQGGVFAGPVTVTVLIPAHNEALSLPVTLASLLTQSHPPERVIVVADNCTDDTVSIAREHGVEVVESVGNTQKKAGALNQALKRVLPGQLDNDVVMIMDADTALDDGFLAEAVARFTSDRALMAIGGLFYGEPGFGLLGLLQRNEYVRYSRELARRRGRVFVLTGTASLFRPLALRSVAENRGVTIPGVPGDVYDTYALTEDNELTLALKSLGGLITSPTQCTVVTELMPTLPALWQQRLRWQRGALENIGTYGLTPATLRYWAQQLGIGYSVIALTSFLSLMVLTLLAVSTWIWFPFWLCLGLVFVTERVVTVWKGGWRARLLAVTVLPELCFDMFLNVVYVKGIVDITLGRHAAWEHASMKVGTGSAA
ncbi:glycosyltransferase family 2 protein [Cryobacterium sp. MDB1-18-2]|uniref:Glycosyltransferase family 2 protein n=2 Tax=Bacteria TaxID=2 RepID=A0ABY2ILZ4_9MICO|nr:MULTISPECIES: glycosyltransferase family 2 protein [Cryobacterium]TFC20453.1 glycosyltransferase family 2 protein [Cryobacterium glucosi]TFC30153.1 glycosyltransferase family 2 protein [Cryobacterium sp. MDB1-18-2]TFC41433.1 glycosyltransferase family 2 protein [Cryobacterium sp. MDB1-18-1]